MTSGTTTIDQRYTLTTACGIDNLAGFYSTKSWSGADDTAVHPKLPRSPPFAYYKWVKRGTKWVQEIHWHKGSPTRPPKRARLRGEHAYSLSLQEYNNATCQWKFLPGTEFQSGTIHSCFGIPTLGGVAWNANDDLKCINKLREKFVGSDFDASVFLGTAHQSFETIADAAVRIARALALVKKGRVVDAAKALGVSPRKKLRKPVNARDIGSDWLALQYGWLPLLKDVHGAAEYAAFQLSFPFQKTYKARTGRNIPPEYAFNMHGPHPIESVSRMQMQIVARVTEKPSPANLAGLTHPENLAWELLPWSFVVDWFLPIGDWLQARSFAQGLHGTFVTTKVSKRFIFGAICNNDNQFSNLTVKGASGYKYLSYQLERTISTTLQVPMPAEKPLAQALSVRHCLNAIALLSQQKIR
jgi:hypothetical protein